MEMNVPAEATVTASEGTMPLYGYECQNEDCEEDEFEELVRRDDADEVCCPSCEGEAIRAKFSTYTIKFKGDGFHRTDYEGKSYQ